jgi:hypothetical protein
LQEIFYYIKGSNNYTFVIPKGEKMAEIIKFVYIMILCVFLLLIVEVSGSKLILIFFISFTIFQSFLVIFQYSYFILQKNVLLTPIVKTNIRIINGLISAATLVIV